MKNLCGTLKCAVQSTLLESFAHTRARAPSSRRLPLADDRDARHLELQKMEEVKSQARVRGWSCVYLHARTGALLACANRVCAHAVVCALARAPCTHAHVSVHARERRACVWHAHTGTLALTAHESECAGRHPHSHHTAHCCTAPLTAPHQNSQHRTILHRESVYPNSIDV